MGISPYRRDETLRAVGRYSVEPHLAPGSGTMEASREERRVINDSTGPQNRKSKFANRKSLPCSPSPTLIKSRLMSLDEPILVARGKNDCYLLPAMANRHGLIAGATGPGKTVTL